MLSRSRFFGVAVLAIVIILVMGLFAGCGGSAVPQDIVDQNQGISRNNAQKNANDWFATVYPPGTVDVKLGTPQRVLAQSDSTIDKTCRFGDGWASASVTFDTGKSLKIKCQTNGTGKGISGCMTEAEFLTKTYKGEEGSCQNLSALEKFK